MIVCTHLARLATKHVQVVHELVLDAATLALAHQRPPMEGAGVDRTLRGDATQAARELHPRCAAGVAPLWPRPRAISARSPRADRGCGDRTRHRHDGSARRTLALCVGVVAVAQH